MIVALRVDKSLNPKISSTFAILTIFSDQLNMAALKESDRTVASLDKIQMIIESVTEMSMVRSPTYVSARSARNFRPSTPRYQHEPRTSSSKTLKPHPPATMTHDKGEGPRTCSSSCKYPQQLKRKSADNEPNSYSLFNRLFVPKVKRIRTENRASHSTASAHDNKMSDGNYAADGGAVGASSETNDVDSKKEISRTSWDKSRKKEVKARLNAEASAEIRPLAVGTVAMMVSALSNQGELARAPV